MKRVIIVSDDSHTQAWVDQALAGLDLQASPCHPSDMQRRLLDGAADLVVLDGGRSPEVLAQVAEHAASGGVDLRLLVLVEPEGLESLRLPVRMPSDFMVRGGSSDELATRVRTILWPGEEVTRQEVIRIDRLTLNLATYQATHRRRSHRLHLPRVRTLRLPGDAPWTHVLTRGAASSRVGLGLLRRFANGRRAREAHPLEDRSRALAQARDGAKRRLPLERVGAERTSAHLAEEVVGPLGRGHAPPGYPARTQVLAQFVGRKERSRFAKQLLAPYHEPHRSPVVELQHEQPASRRVTREISRTAASWSRK